VPITQGPSSTTRAERPVSVSVVVPVFRGGATLADLAQRLERTLADTVDSYEVIFVNDGSPDDSWEHIEQVIARHAHMRAIDLMRNYGQHNALLAGIRAARHDIVVTIDDDLQNPPEEIPKLLARLDEGFDVVYGTPASRQHGLWRELASHLTKIALQSVMGAATARSVSAFRAFRAQVRQGFEDYRSPYVSIDVLLTWGTQRFSSVVVDHRPRAAGESTYTLGRLVMHAVNMITGFSTWPLQMASLVGFAFTLFGLGVLAVVIGRYLMLGYSVPGFPFLASIIAIFSGAQLFTLGVVGEYLARIHFRTMERPAYVVRRQVSGERDRTPDDDGGKARS
jgi:glycosyltransferase involved in cell wall biosynthesis